MAYLVLKPIPIGGGKKLEPGTTVDAENWRNRRTLEAGRYIQRIELSAKPDATAPAKRAEVKPAEPKPEERKPVVESKIAQVKAKLAEEPKKQASKPSKADNKSA